MTARRICFFTGINIRNPWGWLVSWASVGRRNPEARLKRNPEARAALPIWQIFFQIGVFCRGVRFCRRLNKFIKALTVVGFG